MDSSETDKPAKDPITPPPGSAPEQSLSTSTAAVNAEWSGYQAYSHIPPPGFMASNAQAHPYMWAVQHMMPPYVTPPHPYVAMYPQGGLYAHPSMPPGSYPYAPFAMPAPNGMGNTHGSADADSKQPEGKEKLPVKRMRGSLVSLNMVTGKTNEEGKTTGTTANGDCSKSAESGSDGSSEGSDANSHNDSPMNSEGRHEAREADASQNGNSTYAAQNGVVNAPHTMVNHAIAVVPSAGPGAVTGPATNLNIGMDYWSTPASSHIPTMGGNVSASVATGIISAGSRDNLQSQLWLQDERELKRQRRKQSNRESARRSRLRKQAECDELAQCTEVLKEENDNLRSDLIRIKSEYDYLITENTALKERLDEMPEGLGSS